MMLIYKKKNCKQEKERRSCG